LQLGKQDVVGITANILLRFLSFLMSVLSILSLVKNKTTRFPIQWSKNSLIVSGVLIKQSKKLFCRMLDGFQVQTNN
jgi:hypothetical protein